MDIRAIVCQFLRLPAEKRLNYYIKNCGEIPSPQLLLFTNDALCNDECEPG